MYYPENFENKIEFDFIRNYIKGYCLSDIGKEYVDSISISDNKTDILNLLSETMEFVKILNYDKFPDIVVMDERIHLKRLNIKDSYLLENELYSLYKSLISIKNIILFLNKKNENGTNFMYPILNNLISNIDFDFILIDKTNKIIDENGNINDNASPELEKIRISKTRASRNVSKILYSILKDAQKNGYVNENVSPSLRGGRLVIPVIPTYKKRISGIIHDESDTGKTIYVEPTQVVEANNEITELENEERKEIIRILKSISSDIRPYISHLLQLYDLLGYFDFTMAKAKFTILINGLMPNIIDTPLLDWKSAVHPILKIYIDKKKSKENKIIPLDIKLNAPHQRILLISGPNAGGKSVCLKTVGLLQYMLQCGLPIPVDENSKCGIFKKMFINIGDEQSIENDLSTFSSYLLNMKVMLKKADSDSLLLIDEFGGGTEPMIGSALAQAMLSKLNEISTFCVITTHFQNLKQYAQETDGIVNGAMLYDRNEMRPLFQLRIGTPGSSFAIEIARKIGIPNEVIQKASQIVGSEYVSSEKYLQEIVRDKRYWENKRKEIHAKEKKLEDIISQYESDINQLREEKKTILNQAKAHAQSILDESNAIIERTIKEIREADAEKKQTQLARMKISDFSSKINNDNDEDFKVKFSSHIERLNKRKRRNNKKSNQINAIQNNTDLTKIKIGSYVKLKNQQTIGNVLKINNENEVLVAFGAIQMNVKIKNLVISEKPKDKKRAFTFISRETQENIRETTLNFHPEIDVRGMRSDEALQAIKYYIDDAIVASVKRIRILHGTGSGILRTLIRQYLSSLDDVISIRDEHPEFGGAGITIVELE